MNQDTVVNLASQAMSLALKIAGPLLLVALVIGLLDQRLPGRHADPGAEPLADPQDRRRRRRDRRARPVDARPARRLHDRAVHVDPHDGGLVNELLRQARRQRARRLHPRARARDAAVRDRAAVLLADDPAARARHHRRRHLDRPGADRAARPARPQRPAGARRPRDRGPARRARLRVHARRADGGRRIGRLGDRRALGLLLRQPDQPHERPGKRRHRRASTRSSARSSSSSSAATPGRCAASRARSSSCR